MLRLPWLLLIFCFYFARIYLLTFFSVLRFENSFGEPSGHRQSNQKRFIKSTRPLYNSFLVFRDFFYFYFIFVFYHFAFARLPNRILHGMRWALSSRPEPPPPSPHSRRNPIHLVFWYRRSFVCFCRCPRRGPTEQRRKKRLLDLSSIWSISLISPFRFDSFSCSTHGIISIFLFPLWNAAGSDGCLAGIGIYNHTAVWLIIFLPVSLSRSHNSLICCYLLRAVRKCAPVVESFVELDDFS